jgi:transposase InsO family protein
MLPVTKKIDNWWYTGDHKIILPGDLAENLLHHIHRTTHLGTKDLLRNTHLKVLNLRPLNDSIVTKCLSCRLTNTKSVPKGQGTRLRDSKPGSHWEMDFTEIKPGKYGYKYLLVLVDTFSGWTEAFPTKHETAQTVIKKLLEDILPRYGMPALLSSDNGLAFASQVTQELAKILGAKWKLHCTYRPQSSGQVERMNRTLKETLTKLTRETGGDWVAPLPFALYRVWNSPYQLGLTPYEIMFGRPPPILPNLKAELIAEYDNRQLLDSLEAIAQAHKDIWPRLKAIYEAAPPPTLHNY